MVDDELQLDDAHRHLQEGQPARDFASGHLVGVDKHLLYGLERRVARPRHVVLKNEVEDGGETTKSNLVAVDKASDSFFVGVNRLDRHVHQCHEGRHGVAHKPTEGRLDVLNSQHVDVPEDVPMGSEVGIPVVDAGVDAGVGFHRPRSRCGHLHDVVEPEPSCLILERIENLLGVHHSDGEWFTSLLRLGGLGPLVLTLLCVDGEQLSVVGVNCGGGCGGGWRDGCHGCSYSRCDRVRYRCGERCEAGGVYFLGPVFSHSVACVW